MRITREQIRILIREALLHEQGCADREDGCVRQAEDGSWYILNNKKGGIWREGFKSRESAEAVLRVPAVHG